MAMKRKCDSNENRSNGINSWHQELEALAGYTAIGARHDIRRESSLRHFLKREVVNVKLIEGMQNANAWCGCVAHRVCPRLCMPIYYVKHQAWRFVHHRAANGALGRCLRRFCSAKVTMAQYHQPAWRQRHVAIAWLKKYRGTTNEARIGNAHHTCRHHRPFVPRIG